MILSTAYVTARSLRLFFCAIEYEMMCVRKYALLFISEYSSISNQQIKQSDCENINLLRDDESEKNTNLLTLQVGEETLFRQTNKNF